MRKHFLKASLLACLLSTTAIADTSSMSTTTTGMGVLQNDYVTAGVNGTTGTLGSGGSVSPGLLYDSTGTGTFNLSYDYLTPGSPFEGFSVKIYDDETSIGNNYANNNTGTATITGDGTGLTDGTDSLSWTGNWTHNSTTWGITHNYSLGATSEFVDITTSITAGSSADGVWFGRFIDPDAVAAEGDSSTTDNVLGYGVIPDSNVVFSEALSSRYALGLYSTDSNVDAGITGWQVNADAYTENSVDGDGSLTNTGDNTIGLSWYFSGVTAGDILTTNYAYIFGPSAFDAADTAITDGAGGGDTTTTDSWGTLTDVGSATDSASGPTLTGTTTETITSTSEAVSSTLPVLTASITTHDSSVAAGVQTIDRETTTTVTTPIEVTTTTFDRTTETYSDGSTVVTDGTATSTTAIRNDVVTTVTDPGSFTGRIDQVDQMLGLNVHRNMGIADGLTGGRISHDMGNGYSAESNVVSLGRHFTTDESITFGAGLNRINTSLTGNDSTGSIETMGLHLSASKHIDGRDITVKGTANTSSSDMSYSRTIGDFGAQGETTSRDSWGTLTVEKSTGGIRPFAGITAGKKSTDGFAETGDIQAKLLFEGSDETYRYATVGLNVETGLLDVSFARDFDDAETMRIGVGIDRNLNEKVSFGLNAERIMSGDNTSTHVSAGFKINF